jgi:hypothetical protein
MLVCYVCMYVRWYMYSVSTSVYSVRPRLLLKNQCLVMIKFDWTV